MTQFFFFPGHLALVAFVIVAAQMQDSVQRENFDFFGGRVPKGARIVGGDFRRDSNIAREVRLQARQGGKRQDVSGLILAPKAPVKLPQLRIRSHQHID
jgi:hypothetical protein